MKLYLSFLLFAIAGDAIAQSRTNFETSQFAKVTRESKTTENSPDLEQYPYMAVSVLFRGEDKLGKKDFIGYFNKMKFFYTEVTVDYTDRKGQVIKETAPLYIRKCEKGVFSTSVFSDKTLIRKLPVSKYSPNIPTVTISTKITLENEAIKVIKYISDKVKPLVDNPTSVFGPAALTSAYGFFNDVIGQLNEKKTVNSEVGFSSFDPASLGIKPKRYDVVILRPDTAKISGDGFTIDTDTDGRLKLFKDKKTYDQYPFIIEIGLSNFLDLQELPSRFYRSKGNCSITADELNKLKVNFEKLQPSLSNTQEPAEYNLIKLYEYKQTIDEGVAAQGAVDEAKLLAAYNSAYTYFKTKSELNIEPELYKTQYKSIYLKFTKDSDTVNNRGCLVNSIKSLALSATVNEIFPLLEKAAKDISNDELLRLKSYVESTRSLNYITKSNFNSNAVVLINLVETETFVKYFADLVKMINAQDAMSTELSLNMKKLTGLRGVYSNCTLCATESEKASKHFNDLIKDQDALRNNMNFMIGVTNDAVTKANVSLSRLDLLTKAQIKIAVDPTAISKEVDAIVGNQAKLSSYLASLTISAADRTAINDLIAKIQASSKAIADLEAQVSAQFEKNKDIFNKAK